MIIKRMNYNFDKKVVEILNKKFKSKIYSGYDPEDVDNFFDETIEYIKEVNEYRKSLDTIINSYENKINHLTSENKEKEKMINALQTKLEDLNKDGYTYRHMMDKVNRLEAQIQKGNSNKEEKE